MIINKVKELVYQLIAKNEVGGYLDPDEFGNYCRMAQNQKLEHELFKRREGTEVSQSLSEFEAVVPSLIVDGYATLPDDFRYPISAAYTNVASGNAYVVPVEELASSEWVYRLSSELDKPNLEYPAYIMRGKGTMQIAPSTISFIELTYVVNPPNPVWNFTAVSGRRVFEETGSVDFLFKEEDISDLVYRIASMLGLEIRDVEAYQATKSEQMVAEQ